MSTDLDFTFTVNVTNTNETETNVTLHILNASQIEVYTGTKTLPNSTALINGDVQAVISAQLNGTGAYSYFWHANSTVYPNVVNTTGEVQSGPTLTSSFLSSTFSPLYGNPNQDYVFNVTMNSTAGVNITPTIYIVDGSNNVVYSGTGTTITNNNGVAYGTSTATVNITTTGNWRYFWNTSINGNTVRYPVSGYLTGPEVANWYLENFDVPANKTELSVNLLWNTFSAPVLELSLITPSSVELNKTDTNVTVKEKQMKKVYVLPGLANYNITQYYGHTKMIVSSPETGTWQIKVKNENVTDFKVGYWLW